MYNIEDLTAEVVTIKLSNGTEVVTKLAGVDEELTVLTVEDPRMVVVNPENQEMALVPYVFTARAETAFIGTNNVLSVLKTDKLTAEDYLNIVEDDRNEQLEKTPADTEDK